MNLLKGMPMKMITVAGTPSAGKTSVIAHLARRLLKEEIRVAVAKFDALESGDDRWYAREVGIPAIKGLSDYVCPDHYYVSNLEEVFAWGKLQQAEVLFVETAGLCFRCAPHIREVPAITVIDNLGGMDVPGKMGPALSLADTVVVTKGDMVSQAEKEVFRYNIRQVNPTAAIIQFNGLTGTGAVLLKRIVDGWPAVEDLAQRQLRYSMPAAICSYCTGETRIGRPFQSGNVKKIDIEPPSAGQSGAASANGLFEKGFTHAVSNLDR
jgi:Ni2+-binding GTPase involved in maturation of urease and hydrogenase